MQTACDPILEIERHQHTEVTSTAKPNMKFMILVKSSPDIEARLAATSASVMKKQMAEMEKFNDELRKAGAMKDCDGLRPSREGKRVHFDGTLRTVDDGPFTGDLVAGCRRLLDMGVAVHRRGRGLGEALPEPDVGSV